ncbi:histamine N-methyltransferase-like [Ptychodera flava]|uniref:histamine N-methyltransferase-like n=1 Tax=Ptychodera flava TaxID=63121 RepID=UPI00396A9608
MNAVKLVYLTIMAIVAVSIPRTSSYSHFAANGGGTTEDIDNIMMERCVKFGDETGTQWDCETIWSTFQDAFACKDQCDLKKDGYSDYIEKTHQDIPKDATLFWSGYDIVKDRAMDYSKNCAFVTLGDTLTGCMPDDLIWCGQESEDEVVAYNCINYESCENCESNRETSSMGSFWNQASSNLASLSSGTVSIMLSGKRENGAYHEDSFLACCELPNLQHEIVTVVRILLLDKTDSETCSKGTVLDLIEKIKDIGFDHSCIDDPDTLRMASSLKNIYSDVEYYFKTFELYKQRLTTVFDEQWKAEWESIIKGLSERAVVKDKDDIRMLTVATGQGNSEQNVIEILVKLFPNSKLKVDVVEPAKIQLDKFRGSARDIATEHPNVTFQWFEDTFEGYMAKRQENDYETKFHFLMCVHGVYYFEDWSWAVDQFYDLVLPGGVMINTIASGDSDCGKLFIKYREWEGNPTNLVISNDVTSYMKTKGLSYQMYMRRALNNITGVFEEKSTEGNVVLNFLVERRDFRVNAPKALLTKVLDFVTENSREEKGRRYMTCDEVDIVVVKPV